MMQTGGAGYARPPSQPAPGERLLPPARTAELYS